MNALIRLVILTTFACGLCMSPAASAEDIREKVRSAVEASSNEAVIDTQGVVYGAAFGSSEDEIVQKFGKPVGYIRLDAHRTALLYGKSHLLLCFDGKFDAIRISHSMLDWSVSRWVEETAPFTFMGWRLSNGLKPEMSRKEVSEIVKAEPGSAKYNLTFLTEQCVVQLAFSHRTSLGDADEAYSLYGLLMASKHDGRDNWSEPPRPSFRESMKGKKLLGIQVADNEKGVWVETVLPNSPANKAGIKPGDLITGLNGESTVGMKAADFSRRVGEQDSNKLEVLRGEGSKLIFQIERADAASF
jgi:hypothetical protein